MDEKRFTELFPEPEKNTGHGKEQKEKEDEKKREEFFCHMKMQIQPKKRWELSQTWKPTLRKKRKEKKKILVYGATAAAFLILIIVLPNLSVFLKMSGWKEKDVEKTEEADIIAETTEHIQAGDDNKLNDAIPDNSTIENSTLGGNTGDFFDQGQSTEKSNPGIMDYHEDSSNDSSNDSNGSHKKESGKKKKENTEAQKQNDQNLKDKPNSENQKNDNTKQETFSFGSKDQAADIGHITGLTIPEENAETDSDANMPSTSDDFFQITEEPVGNDEEAAETTSEPASAQVPTESKEEMTEADFNHALNGWWEKEDQQQETALTGNTNSNQTGQDNTEKDVIEDTLTETENTITKEKIERELTAYPYLYYNQKEEEENWYQAGKKIQKNTEGKELLGTALIFKKKSLVIDHQNMQQNVYIYGDKNDLSIVFVRFQAEGEDWYYEYKKQEE